MTNATLPLKDLDESIASLEEGESCEVCAMLKVVSKSGDSMEVELSDFEKDEDYSEEDDGMESESEDDYAGEQAPAARPKGKGMGILIMVKPSGKKY